MLRLGKRRMAGAVNKFVNAPFFRARKPNADADRQKRRATDERGSRIFGWLGSVAGMPILLLLAGPAFGKQIVSCGGAVLLGGAQLLCSHVDPSAPPQICTYSWAMATPANQTQIVEGSFLIPPGTSNLMVYQGSGFVRALSEPIVLCQGKRGGG